MATSPLDALREQSIDLLGRLLSPGDTAALLDYPAYLNAGDALIFRGEVAYLRALGVNIDYVSALHTHDDELLASRCPDGPLLLQGGGNWGDRYDRHQLFREQVVARHPERTIIALPQSLDYSTDEALRRTQSVYRKHPNLHLLLRDDRSFEHAREAFPHNHVHLCPDMAFGVGALRPSTESSHQAVVLKRLDGESVHDKASLPDALRSRALVTDWSSQIGRVVAWQARTGVETVTHRVRALRHRVYPAQRRAFDKQSAATVAHAVGTISQGRIVITDRLHAAVFGALMNKPVVMIDNATRKLSAAYESHLQSFPGVRLAGDFTEAAFVADRLLQQHG